MSIYNIIRQRMQNVVIQVSVYSVIAMNADGPGPKRPCRQQLLTGVEVIGLLGLDEGEDMDEFIFEGSDDDLGFREDDDDMTG